MQGKMKYLLTGIVVLIAAAVFALKYWAYITNPWTRDGQVRAQVIQITPRVSGPLAGVTLTVSVVSPVRPAAVLFFSFTVTPVITFLVMVLVTVPLYSMVCAAREAQTENKTQVFKIRTE